MHTRLMEKNKGNPSGLAKKNGTAFIEARKIVNRKQQPNTSNMGRFKVVPIVSPNAGFTEPSNVQSIITTGFRGHYSDIPYKKEMEKQFGTSFSHVKAFFGRNAETAVRNLGAEALNIGDRIAFASRIPKKKTVKHELVHVIQRKGQTGKLIKNQTLESEPAEQEAKFISSALSSGQQIPKISEYLLPSIVALYRTPESNWHIVSNGQVGEPWRIEYVDEAGNQELLIHTNLSIDEEPDWRYLPDEIEEILRLPERCLNQDVIPVVEFHDDHLDFSYPFVEGVVNREDVQARLEGVGLVGAIDEQLIIRLQDAVQRRSGEDVISVFRDPTMNSETASAIVDRGISQEIRARFGQGVYGDEDVVRFIPELRARQAERERPSTRRRRRGTSSRAHTTPGPRTTIYSNRVDVSPDISLSGMPPITRIDYLVEFNRAHNDTPDRYVLYVIRINGNMSYREFLTFAEPSYCLEEEVDETEQTRRAVFVLERIAESGVFNPAEPFEEHQTPQCIPAYVFTDPGHIRPGIREALRRQRPTPTRTELYEEMPLGETPEQWSAGEYNAARREAAIDWLAFLVGEPVRTYTLGHVRYDTERLLRSPSRLGWIRQFRRFLRDGIMDPII